MGYFEIGKITGTHGIKGTFKVFPTTENPSRFELLDTVILDMEGQQQTLHISKIAYHKNMVLVTVKEINDINVAEQYKNATLLIPEEEALALDENEYYTRDLYDMTVVTEDGEILGILTDILVTGANDVYVVSKDGEKDLLIPAIKECIREVRIDEKRMVVHLLKGLR